MTLKTVGKWYQIAFDEDKPLVILPVGDEVQPNVARVVAAGPLCVSGAGAGDRILFQKDKAQPVIVDGYRLYLLHEDHLLAILPQKAKPVQPAAPLDHRLDQVSR